MHTPRDLLPPFDQGLNYGAFPLHSLNCSDMLLHDPSLRKYSDSADKRQGKTPSAQNSKKNELIQIADFIAGSLGYIFDELKKSEHSNEFQNILTLGLELGNLNYYN